MFYHNRPASISRFTKPHFFKGGEQAVLLIHGYTGSPREMLWLGTQLHKAGYTVSIPRLPGHGTNKDDFMASSWKDWLRCVYDEYVNLAEEYATVFVGGLSMGGVLTALLAAKFQPEKIFLCAPAFVAADTRIKLTPYLRYFIKTLPSDGKPFYPEPEFYDCVKDYCNYSYVGKAADLYRLQKMAVRELPNIRSKTITVLSKADKSVPFREKELIDRLLKAPNEYVILEESSHIVTDDVDRELVAQRIIEFLAR
jgi:Esterase/lipase|nr:alpha/beta fold hydrolase [uncultured Treponema sp.]